MYLNNNQIIFDVNFMFYFIIYKKVNCFVKLLFQLSVCMYCDSNIFRIMGFGHNPW